MIRSTTASIAAPAVGSSRWEPGGQKASYPPSQPKLNAVNDMPMMTRRRSTRLRQVTDPKFVVIGRPDFDLHQIGARNVNSAARLRKGRAGCQFRWLRIETRVPTQLKRWFTKRTAYRKQRAIIMSHSSTPNISS